MKSQLLLAASAVALMMGGQSAQANTLVGTIVGAYDSSCASINCTQSGLFTYTTDGGTTYDTPSLYIYNRSSTTWTGVQAVLNGYQELNNGDSLTLSLPNIAPHTVYQLIWNGSTTPGNLFAYDYDDEYVGTASILPSGTTDASGHSCGSGSGTASGYCAFVGNFDVSFSAMMGSTPISSNFSPDPTQPGGNVPGTFVPWEGLDVNGLSETYADQHTLTNPGTMANIFTGTGVSGGTKVPEPLTMTLFGAGLAALGMARRRRKPAK